jgi:molybdate transport system substrate-binding protein
MRHALVIVMTLLAASGTARAAEIDALISTAVKAATDELLPRFEATSGNTIRASYGPSGALIPRFERGDPTDLFLTDRTAIVGLIKQGNIVGAPIDFARTGIGIAVRKGAPRPDVSTPEAFKQALLAAKSVAYAAPAGGSITGPHLERVFAQLGIAVEIKAKAKLAAGGPDGRVSVMVSSGEAEIGMQQVSELMSNPDVDVIGLLPAPLQQITIYSGGITARTKQPAAAEALIRFLAAPEATAIYKSKGLGL